MSDYDVILIGAGHNGLTCAGYLARAGYRVGLFERQPLVGGAVVTQDFFNGFKFDMGGSIPNMVNLAPIIEELELAKYGYSHAFLDPMLFAPYADGSHLMFWRDIEQTCESISAISAQDAEAYRRFARDCMPVMEVINESMNVSPSPLNLARTLGGGFLTRVHSPLSMANMLRLSTAALVERYFSNPKVQAAVNWTGLQSGLGIDEPFGAFATAWYLNHHSFGATHPRGGVGMLTNAMAAMIRAYGGEIHTDCPVETILSRGNRVTGIRLGNGETVSASKVVSAAHIQTTMGLLGETVATRARKKIDALELGNGLGLAVRVALNELPDYTALPGQNGPQHIALQWICPDMDYARRASADHRAGLMSAEPLLMATTISAADPEMAPPGKHTLNLWGQYFPYQLADGKNWEDLREQAAEKLLAKLAEYAPNVRSAVIDKFIDTPMDLERMFGMPRANITHLPMSLPNMFMLRPALELSQYRGPLKGLYLSGASTHPGGGITGQPGRNAAQVILRDFSKKQ